MFGIAYPPRLILKDVPQVGYFVREGSRRSPEGVPFPSCLRAVLEYIGESYGAKYIEEQGKIWRLDNLYTYLMGVSGAAFRLSWRPGWHGDNVEIMYMSSDPAAPFDRMFEAVGYRYNGCNYKRGYGDEAYVLDEIKASLSKNIPVIGFGIIGPPEACLITGYDEQGDVLIGWNFFQDMPDFNAGVEFEPSGYFRKQHWMKDFEGIIVLGEKREKLPKEAAYRKALEWALTVARIPDVWPERANGHAAYKAWAKELLRDDEFAGHDLPVLAERFMVHDDAVCTVAEGRWYGMQFLLQAAEALPSMKDDLMAAAKLFETEHDLMLKVWRLVGGNGRDPDKIRKLAEPKIRRQIAALIYEARSKDIEAGDHIARALGHN